MNEQVENPIPAPNSSEEFRTFQKGSENFGNIPKPSEAFGTVPQHSEGFRRIPHASERKENHTLTVREAARLFEAAGVARTERSIVNWCQPNKMGVARLDYYFDPNERKYFISPQSVEAAIQEEMAKAVKGHFVESGVPKVSESLGNIDTVRSRMLETGDTELESEIRDLQIATRFKDKVIEFKDKIIEELQKQNERENIAFREERQGYIAELMTFNRKVGELETRLLQLSAPPTPAKDEREDGAGGAEIRARVADSIEDPTVTRIKLRKQ